MKVYISAHDSSLAQQLAHNLIIAVSGIEIVSTWHKDGNWILLSNADEWVKRSTENFKQITLCDVFIMIASKEHATGQRRYAGGKFIEAGFALGMFKPAYILGDIENGMLHYPGFIHMDNVEELILYILYMRFMSALNSLQKAMK